MRVCQIKWRTLIIFYPQTGRTHQLRVHSASEESLGMPIVGDRLYGKDVGSDADRLHLHVTSLSLTFPLDGHLYDFESPFHSKEQKRIPQMGKYAY